MSKHGLLFIEWFGESGQRCEEVGEIMGKHTWTKMAIEKRLWFDDYTVITLVNTIDIVLLIRIDCWLMRARVLWDATITFPFIYCEFSIFVYF